MRNQRTARCASLLGAGLLLMAACTDSGTNGTPATSPPVSTAQGKKAPPVPAPLNPASLEAEPCSAVTPDQVASLGLPQKNAEPDGDPGSCDWRFVTGGNPSSFSGSLANVGLQRTYDLNKDDPSFTEFTVSGYPGTTLLPGGSRPGGASQASRSGMIWSTCCPYHLIPAARRSVMPVSWVRRLPGSLWRT